MLSAPRGHTAPAPSAQAVPRPMRPSPSGGADTPCADPSDRSFGGLMKLAKAAKAMQSSPEYAAMVEADMRSAWAAAERFKPDAVVAPNIM